MPELPEVETVIRGIRQNIVGQSLEKIEILDPKLLIATYPLTRLENWGELREVSRKGKLIILDFTSGQSILIHLRMTGQLVYRDLRDNKADFGLGHPNQDLRAAFQVKATRAIFGFNFGTLYFNDQRRFGLIEQITTSALAEHQFIKNLGLDALDSKLTAIYLNKLLAKRKITIKGWLLSQNNIAGIGNIYADESLHLAKIHPGAMGGELSLEQINILLQSIQKILNEAIQHQGYTYRNYVNIAGEKGSFAKYARVYNRANLICQSCGRDKIKKIKIASRGTYFCPSCQILT